MRYVVVIPGTSGVFVSDRDVRKIRSAMAGGDGVVKVTNLDNNEEKEIFLNPKIVAWIYPE